jgi:hypothetical protein
MAKIRNEMKDLTTEQGRKEAEKEIENSFLNSLRTYGFQIADDSVCVLDKNKIELGIESTKKDGWRIDNQSSIDLYAERKGKDVVYMERENSINFGTSGNFTANDKACYWRTIHAAEILKQWEFACKLINQHCKAYAKLEKQIFNTK